MTWVVVDLLILESGEGWRLLGEGELRHLPRHFPEPWVRPISFFLTAIPRLASSSSSLEPPAHKEEHSIALLDNAQICTHDSAGFA